MICAPLWQSERVLAMVGAVPVVETERLRLRGQRLDDFDKSAALWADPAVTRFIGGKASTREECWMRLLRNVGHWSLLGFGYWAVEEKSSGHMVGEIGFSEFKREIEPSFEASPRPVGFWRPSHTVRGLGPRRSRERLLGATGSSQAGRQPAS